MFHHLFNHWNIAIPIAVAILNIIALIAILFAPFTSERAFSHIFNALRKIDKLSAFRLSRSSASLPANQDEAKVRFGLPCKNYRMQVLSWLVQVAWLQGQKGTHQEVPGLVCLTCRPKTHCGV